MELEKFYIPKHLDDAPRFLLWSIDEAMSVLIPLFLGMLMNIGILAPILAIISFKSWKRIKGSGGPSLVKSFIYWHYPRSLLDLKFTPDSSIKNYIG